MPRGMEAPECVFCIHYKRYGRDRLVRPEDVHICMKHGVKIPWQPGMHYVCSDFTYAGGEDGNPSDIKPPRYIKPGALYGFPSIYQKANVVAEFSKLEKAPPREDIK